MPVIIDLHSFGTENIINRDKLPINMGNKKAIWLTDVHFNFLTPKDIQRFIAKIQNESPEIVLVGGDTGEAHDVASYLGLLEQSLDSQIFFVLGNHDFYWGSLSQVKEEVSKITKGCGRLFYLDEIPFVELSENTALVGHSGWADGRLGNYEISNVMLNDYILIREFAGLTKNDRLKQLNDLGDRAASKLQFSLEIAVRKYKNILCLTHVPPFKESCWHEGSLSNDDYLPHFACKAVGDVLRTVMQGNPDSYLTVLCGHTHSPGKAQILSNLEVLTGEAEYGEPKIQKVIYL